MKEFPKASVCDRNPAREHSYASANEPPVIEIDSFSVSYAPNTYALENISLSVHSPEIIAIIGPSGSGKSTLLKSICGLIQPETGSVRFRGNEVIGAKGQALRRIQRRIGFVWQESSLVGRSKVLTNVLAGNLEERNWFLSLLGWFHPKEKYRALESLKRVRMGAYHNRRLDRLSGGEKQRVGIARAFISQPEIVLADEPVASLDPVLASEVLEDLARLAKEDRKVVLVSLHQTELARRFANRIIGIADGAIVFDGKPEELTDSHIKTIYHREDARSSADESSQSANLKDPATFSRWPQWSWKTIAFLGALSALYFCAIRSTDLNPVTLAEGSPHIVQFVGRLFPPEWDYSTWKIPGGWTIQYPMVITTLWETLLMAVLGTTIGAIISLPLSLLAASNVSPHSVVYNIMRFLPNANRAVPDIVFALIMVAALGLGPFAGTLAIAMASVGSLSKVFAEVIESVDPQPVTAMKATGAGPLLSFRYALLPQALPVMASYSILYFEANLRTATILGLVGAGGVGFIIHQYYNLFQYQKLMGAIILIILAVTMIDRLSDAIRKRLL